MLITMLMHIIRLSKTDSWAAQQLELIACCVM